MNLARARRRWKAWDRYAHRCYEIGGACAIPSGYSEAAGQRYRVWLRKQERQARRDAQQVVSAVLDAYLPLIGGRP